MFERGRPGSLSQRERAGVRESATCILPRSLREMCIMAWLQAALMPSNRKFTNKSTRLNFVERSDLKAALALPHHTSTGPCGTGMDSRAAAAGWSCMKDATIGPGW